MSRHQEYTSQIVVRCTPEEREHWKALADRLDKAKALELRQTGVTWRYRDQRVNVSTLVRQLLERELKAHPPASSAPATVRGARVAAARSRRRRRNTGAAAATS